MTPVQLPEVPEHSYGFNPNQRESGDAFRWRPTASHPERLYTADQLRAYATEAVMAERARLESLVQKWIDAARLNEWNEAEAESFGAESAASISALRAKCFRHCADDLAALLSTQPEQNSGR